jgi:hypothetical protein
MLLILGTLIQSAFACGPYGDAVAFSDEGSYASATDGVVQLFTSNGDYFEIEGYGDVTAMAFVEDELLVAFSEKRAAAIVLIDQDGEEVSEWSPRANVSTIDSIDVRPFGVRLSGSLARHDFTAFMSDDLDLVRFRVFR